MRMGKLADDESCFKRHIDCNCFITGPYFAC